MNRQISDSEYFKVEPLEARFNWGVRICELEPAELSKPQVRRELKDLWIREGVILFRGLDSVETQIALSQVFGPLIEHPVRESVHSGARELIDLIYSPADGWISLVNDEERGQWLPWHSDLIYVDKINHGGILRPVRLPSRMGQTGFIDKICAYDELADELKRRIEGLHVVYQYDMDVARIRFGPDRGGKVLRYSPMAARAQARIHEYPMVIHPMVYAQPETGRKVLNVSPWFAQGIHEMRNAEGDELLDTIAQHVAAAHRAYYHHWQLGEMLLWDNWRMLHCGVGAPRDEERYMQRTTIAGDYGLGQLERAGETGTDGLKYVHV